MKHWYKIVHGECVSQSYALYDLDGIGEDAEAAKKAAFKLLNVGDTLAYADDKYDMPGEYFYAASDDHMYTKKMSAVEDMPKGSLPWYAKPSKGYHAVFYWVDENKDYDGFGFMKEFLEKKEILDGRGIPIWNGK